MRDINNITIKVGDTVETRQHPGGILAPAPPTIGIVEPVVDAFGMDTIQIRYRKPGKEFDSFILLSGKINKIINT